VRERASVEQRFQKTPVGNATGDRKRGWDERRERERSFIDNHEVTEGR
jgi:hypothetical protein